MKKKMIFQIAIVVVVLVCIITFFKPLSFSDIVNEKNQIIMILNEFGIRDGEAHIDSDDYQDITAEQKHSIINVLKKYTYRRTFGTPFSDGSISELGDKMLSVYVYDDVSLILSIIVSSSGRIAINEKTYSMKNAEQLITRLMKIVE